MTTHRTPEADGSVDAYLTPLPPGTMAPNFTLRQTPRLTLSLRRLSGRPVILTFFPSPFEPVSREQLTLYQAFLPEFESLGAHTVGISADHAWSHEAFARAARISFPLLADTPPYGNVSQQYGVYREVEDVTGRALFVVDSLGIIRFAQGYPDLLNPGVDDLLTVLEALRAGNTGETPL